MRSNIATALTTLAISYVLFSGHADAIDPPPKGLVTEGIVVSVYDGDTVTVVPTLPAVNLRIRNCWAPEIRGSKLTEETKLRGFESRDHLRKLLPEGETVRIRVLTTDRLSDSLSFGRAIADVWNSKGVDVAEAQVSAGHATRFRE